MMPKVREVAKASVGEYDFYQRRRGRRMDTHEYDRHQQSGHDHGGVLRSDLKSEEAAHIIREVYCEFDVRRLRKRHALPNVL